MPQTPHIERHFTGSDFIRDLVIGMSDGLTVPFALAAGLSGAVKVTSIIVTAGLAEIAAGSIAMGLGGYLAGRSDAEHYASERVREELEIKEKPDEEVHEVEEELASYGLTAKESGSIVEALRRNPQAWLDFMMRFELGLEKPEAGRALVSGLTIAGAYIAGGLVPLAPYMLSASATVAFIYSVVVTSIALMVFGAIKGHFTGKAPAGSSIQTWFIGGVAAAAAYIIARTISAR